MNQTINYNVEPTEEVVRYTNEFKFMCEQVDELNEVLRTRDEDELYEELHQVSKMKQDARQKMREAQKDACLKAVEGMCFPEGRTYIKFINMNHSYQVVNCLGYIVLYVGVTKMFDTEEEVKSYLKKQVENMY